MATDGFFDELSKDTAHGLSRRQVLARLLAGTGLAALSLFGLNRFNGKDCGKLCEACCHNAFPDHGPEYGQCMSACHHGEGLCGPIVCPKD